MTLDCAMLNCGHHDQCSQYVNIVIYLILIIVH